MSGPNKHVTTPKCGMIETESSCAAVREVLNKVGDKWSILIVSILEDGTKRFSEIQRSIQGISQRMLTRTLRELERDGMVTRKVEPTVPPSVFYTLTPLGKTILVPVKAMASWALENYPKIHEAQKQFDKKSERATD